MDICKCLTSEDAKQVSARQGCTLSALIEKSGYAWNSQFGGGAVSAPSIININDAKLYILSPSQEDLSILCKAWRKELLKKGLLSKAHSMEYWDDAFEFMMANEKPGFRFHIKPINSTTNVHKIKETPYHPDTSATNGSSISFVLECKGKRVLFLGDSHAETIVKSLSVLFEKEPQPIMFDAIKLSHHGSFNNNSPELLKLIDSDHWLVSTNGDLYNHPDMPTIIHIITKDNLRHRYVHFNYNLPICDELEKKEYHIDYLYTILSQKDGKRHIITI